MSETQNDPNDTKNTKISPLKVRHEPDPNVDPDEYEIGQALI